MRVLGRWIEPFKFVSWLHDQEVVDALLTSARRVGFKTAPYDSEYVFKVGSIFYDHLYLTKEELEYLIIISKDRKILLEKLF